MITIAIQKSGRLNEESQKMLKKCGIFIDNGKDQLKAPARNFPMEVLYLRNGDIPQYIRDGVVDLAIIGENILEEKGGSIKIIEKLNFSNCRVSIAVPKETNFNGEWFLSTRQCIDAKNSKWTSEKSYYEMFMECIGISFKEFTIHLLTL